MKIRGNIPFAQENLAACVVDGTNVYHQNLDMIDEMKHLPGARI